MYPAPPHRLHGFPYTGLSRYSLRFCTNDRARIFVSDESVAVVLAQFLRAALETRMAVIVYCFMPEHVHLLVEGVDEAADCRAFIVRAKQYSAFYYRLRFGERLWQRYAFERVLREDEPTESVARYILGNPVRAGLVMKAEDHRYLGSTRYTIGELLRSVED
jgi:putative transposase